MIKSGLSVNGLIHSNDSIENLVQKIFNVLISEEIASCKSYNDFLTSGIHLLPQTPENSSFYQYFFDKLDVSEIHPVYIDDMLNNALESRNMNLFELLVTKLDFSKLKSYQISKVLDKAIEKGDVNLLEILVDKLDLSKLDSYTSDVVSKAIEKSNAELLEILVDKLDLSKLRSYQILEALSKAIEKVDVNLLEILVDKLDLPKLDLYTWSLVSKAIETSNAELVEMLVNKLDFSKLDSYYTSEALGKAIETGNVKLVEKLDFSKLAYVDATMTLYKASGNEKLSIILSNKMAEIMHLPDLQVLPKFLDCWRNQECKKECYEENLSSYMDCYGKYSNMDSEL